MKLWQLRRHWDALARADPYFAVLTNADKQGNKWAIDEFYSTGVAEVDRDMERIRACAGDLPKGPALDFGCGAGRLTQALARHFGSVTGVDISEAMVALARAHCSDGRVRFVHNARSDLSAFPGGSFALVYSRITLQHIAPAYTHRYLGEFLRLLAPGGILSVQVPESVPPGAPPDRLRFSTWPPTMWMRLARHIRYHHPGWFPGSPKMQMYAVARARVLGSLAEAGAEVLAVERIEHDEVVNLTYLARRKAAP
jgi:SAM-dependent methyltransferase